MPVHSTRKKANRLSTPGKKVSKTYRLAPEKLIAAQRILGTATATEAIETALDMIVFRQELLEGTKRLQGMDINFSDG